MLLSQLYRPTCLQALLANALAVTVFIAAGCGQSQSTTSVVAEQPLKSAPTTSASTENSSADQQPRKLVRESWEIVLVGGSKVGYSHFEESETQVDDRSVRELVSSNEMSMQRFGQTVTQSIEASSVETQLGQVLRFGTKMQTGPTALTIKGEYRDGKMLIETGTLGKTQTSSLDWNPAWGGFFADQQSLKQQPMTAGEQRTITAIVPGTAQVGEIKITAKKRESTQLLGTERELLRIESSLNIAGTQITSIMWADEAGEVLKTAIPGLNHETYRVTKDVALRPADKSEFDLGTQTVVKVDRPIESPHTLSRAVYRARLKSGSPAEVFSSCRSQSVKKIDEHTAEITVKAIRPTSDKVAITDSGDPTDGDLQPNNLIQSDDGAIISLAERFTEGETDPWALAKRFEAGVRDYVHSKNFSQAIGSAADVVRRAKAIAQNMPCCLRHSVERRESRPELQSGWSTTAQCKALLITCGTKSGSRTVGCRSMLLWDLAE